MKTTWSEVLNQQYTEDNIKDSGMCFMYKNKSSFNLPTLKITVRCYDFEKMVDCISDWATSLSRSDTRTKYITSPKMKPSKYNITDFYADENKTDKVLSIEVIKVWEDYYGA